MLEFLYLTDTNYWCHTFASSQPGEGKGKAEKLKDKKSRKEKQKTENKPESSVLAREMNVAGLSGVLN